MLLRITQVLISAALICLGACSSVTTPHLLGEPVDNETAGRLTGAWLGDESIAYSRHVGRGEFRLASTKWDTAQERFVLEESTVFIRSLNGALIIHVRTDESDEGAGAASPEYSIARLVLTEKNEIILLSPAIKRFIDAVKAGEFKGEISGEGGDDAAGGFFAGGPTTVHLGGTKEEIEAAFTRERITDLFTIEESGVLRRVEGVKID